MRIYLDEDIASGILGSLLQRAGHDVQTPAQIGFLGRSDAVQLTLAIREDRVFLTANYDDFEELHLLLREAHGQHPGVLTFRQENNPTRDLTPKGIVNAIRKLEAAGVPIRDEYVILNQWR